jgi:hypothetical protein
MEPTESVALFASDNVPLHPIKRAGKVVLYLAKDGSPVFWVPIYSVFIGGLSQFTESWFTRGDGVVLPYLLQYIFLFLGVAFAGVLSLLSISAAFEYASAEIKKALTSVRNSK